MNEPPGRVRPSPERDTLDQSLLSLRTMHEHDELDRYIDQLQSLAVRLRYLGLVILLATMANLGVVVAGASSAFSRAAAAQLAAMFFVFAVLSGMLFEQFRRRGEVIYGEVTDELHRGFDDSSQRSPRMSFRIALKNFASSMELPLIPGRYGVAVYLLVNLLAMGFALSIYPSIPRSF